MKKLKSILFIGVNKSGSSREATRVAEKLGYFIVLFTSNDRQYEQRELYPEIHKMVFVDTTNMEAMRTEITKLQKTGLDFKTIVSFVDPYVHIASLLCDEFCINLTSSKAIEMMEDKEETRKFLMKEAYSPQFKVIGPNEKVSGKLTFPLILKSPKSTGSKDVLLAQDLKQFNKHLTSLQKKYPEETIIAEEYLRGPQYLVEVIVYKHQPHIVAVMKQDITKGKRFIITGYRLLATVPPNLVTSLDALCESIVNTFNIETGAFHLELRLTSKGWKLVEVNPRISGGAMNKMIEAAYGINLVEQTLKLFLGEEPDLQPTQHYFVYTKYLIVKRKGILERVTGKLRATKSPGVYDVYIKPKKGTLLIPPLSMGHRYAYIIAQGKSISEAVRLANQASRLIKFHMREP
ncbi:ATP-grasp domain-containing protein [Solibacillus sp. FSL R7-0682]|uniref:ATP-grasp domain-containing protein n=1 Tax=Solibacillus sp. FSL R7-0682 TaxID=2921690 RepID=UPI0030F97131